ncbi:MAG: TetR family transcriptional regulator [Herbiconiux sp.]|uniref:TetR family transcriptional regulator n=1 Tax=Herbiconiux sp. TaxID=1871186 RepID=UPI0011F97A34|nr:TetR family transcriptional regulator [Herbiconiux sp.]TAJ49381.1 MAG: TetR family transcriptional regulator [Herbiconiux sp.]
MGRWEPDAAGRLARAALELYSERGFDQTTALDIAERAGVTERTFFRHFADKREVLFDGSSALLNAVVASIAAAPEASKPLDVMGQAMQSGTALLEERRDHARLRAVAIAAHPSLQERELLKMSTLGEASAEALRARGVPSPAAELAADAGVAVFGRGFEAWIAPGETRTLAECIGDALAELRRLTA